MMIAADAPVTLVKCGVGLGVFAHQTHLTDGVRVTVWLAARVTEWGGARVTEWGGASGIPVTGIGEAGW
jgi:hypothetical protein